MSVRHWFVDAHQGIARTAVMDQTIMVV